ncbi:hypothetical protein CYMTET_50892 [Cymbomonas tetramitiformis]|uniref:Sulphur transport domain-containing protein n=1 Tax=Cymbomonas tetramitiformis TaxID=36881 RepID=A0AAE0BNX5_9CHLO|nr:hypothetical protein CYMTET_50892 [Cymbomonas tetramitiformis]|eukprot:gene24002-29123_t
MAPYVWNEPLGLLRGFGGGVVIALATSVLLALTGETAGISGIVAGCLKADTASWRYAFVIGLLMAGAILRAVPDPEDIYGPPLQLQWPYVVVGGVFVGFGTRLGNGCTSGHGVCGLSRISVRSLLAVCSFMASGIVTAGVSRAPFSRDDAYDGGDLDPASKADPPLELGELYVVPLASVITTSLLLMRLATLVKSLSEESVQPPADTSFVGEAPESAPSAWDRAIGLSTVILTGITFGLGLGLSGMCSPHKVLRFLDFLGDGGWDPQLGFVMGGAVAVNLVTFRLMAVQKGDTVPPLQRALSKPENFGKSKPYSMIISYGYSCPENRKIDWRLIIGAILFGSGWGLSGVCPGPAIVGFVSGEATFSLAVPSILFGMTIFHVATRLEIL